MTITQDKLIERLEKAAGPDREWDGGTIFGLFYASSDKPPDRFDNAPRYTSSIDAALTLFPLDTGYILYRIIGKKPSVSTRCYEWDDHVNAATAPLALCIAALKTRNAS